MKSTMTRVGSRARKAVLDGVNAIYIPVRASFGPEGKSALIYRTFNRGPRITRDGVTIAEVQSPKDPFIKMAAEAFREGCKRTVEKVGDGTTATAVIGGRLFNDIYTLLNEGKSEFTANKTGKVGVMTLRNKIKKTADLVKKKIRENSREIKTLSDLEKVATVSVKDEELGKIIAKMAWDVGVDGFIDVVEGYKGEIETEVIKGMRFPSKVPAKAFVNNPNRYEMLVKDCPVLITNIALDNAAEVGEVFQKLNAVTSKIIVVAPSFSDNVLINMVNATKSGYFFHPVLAPALRTEQMEDFAIYCGATLIDKNKGRTWKSVTPADLGFLEKLIVKDSEAREDAVATGGKGTYEVTLTKSELKDTEEKNANGKTVKKKERVYTDVQTTPIKERIETLKGQLAETRQEQFKLLLERRIASMASAVGIIRVGGSTQADSLYMKLNIEDAVFASRSALRNGYVKGGGICLKEIADALPDDDILKAALLEPYKLIQDSVDGGLAIGSEIIDPTDAIYYAVEHATSIVANLAMVEVITPEVEDDKDGDYAVARSIGEVSIAFKRHLGLLKENEEEAERERMAEFDRVTLTDKD